MAEEASGDGEDPHAKLGHKRTELAYERTVLAYFRTGASLIVFGVAFLGFRQQSGLFLYGGYIALAAGIGFFLIALIHGRKHLHEIQHLTDHELEKMKEVRHKAEETAKKVLPTEES